MYRPLIEKSAPCVFENTVELTREWVRLKFEAILDREHHSIQVVATILEMLYLGLHEATSTIRAIAMVKVATGMGLKEAKNFVVENGIVFDKQEAKVTGLEREVERLHTKVREQQNALDIALNHNRMDQKHLAD